MHSQKKPISSKTLFSADTKPDTDKGETPSHLDFSSADFNQVDELDDTKENYREFENLKGVVTSDMRFQALRRQLKERGESTVTEAAAGIKHGNAEENQVADGLSSKPLIMVSEGRVLIVAAEEQPARDSAEILTKNGLRCSICITGESRPSSSAAPFGAAVDQTAGVPVIHGYFCGFNMRYGNGQPGEAVSAPVGRLSDSAGKNQRCFDMVLDMRSRPCYAGEQLPLGYYAVGQDRRALHSALREIAEMKGRFSKPRLVALRLDGCIRARHPQVKCDRCLQICSFTAIEEEDGRLAADALDLFPGAPFGKLEIDAACVVPGLDFNRAFRRRAEAILLFNNNYAWNSVWPLAGESGCSFRGCLQPGRLQPSPHGRVYGVP